MKFKNEISEEVLSHAAFVEYCWSEAERQFEELNDELWCNLNKYEQIILYCEQYEHQLNDRGWNEVK